MIHTNIIEVHETVDIWPGRSNAKRCVCIGADNRRYDANVPNAELALVMKMQLMKSAIGRDFDILAKLIEEYGSEMHDKGRESCECSEY